MTISSQLSADGQELTITIQGRFDFNTHQAFRDAYQGAGSSPRRYVVDLDRDLGGCRIRAGVGMGTGDA